MARGACALHAAFTNLTLSCLNPLTFHPPTALPGVQPNGVSNVCRPPHSQPFHVLTFCLSLFHVPPSPPPPSALPQPSLAYFPTVSLSFAERCELNFGARPFLFPVAGFAPLQVSYCMRWVGGDYVWDGEVLR